MWRAGDTMARMKSLTLLRATSLLSIALVGVVALALVTSRVAEAAPAPTISSIAPAIGASAGGTSITITGTGFVAGVTVSVGGVAATGVTLVSATSITATTLASGYTYNPLAAPTVTSVAPATGPAAGGTSITITGTGFVTGASVSIGGGAATNVVVVTATSITAVTPQRAAGSAAVSVTNNDTQTGTLLAGFTATANAAPTVSSVTPNTGTTSGGTSISIAGTGFLPNADVLIGGTPATQVSVVSATVITATAPANAAGAVSVTVTNYDGLSGTNATGYTYKANAAPTVTAAAPATGPLAGGTSVTITGTGFAPGALVRFGNNYATSSTVAGTTAILATTPAGLAGVTPIVVTNPDGQVAILSTGFGYEAFGTGSPNVAEAPPAGGVVFVQSGTNDLQALLAAQSFKVLAAFWMDTATQVWKAYVVGAPTNSLTTVKSTDVVVLRR